jgi:hypothetical protein
MHAPHERDVPEIGEAEIVDEDRPASQQPGIFETLERLSDELRVDACDGRGRRLYGSGRSGSQG